jgi:hypothetical protein
MLETELQFPLDCSRRPKRIHTRAQSKTKEVSSRAMLQRAGSAVGRTYLSVECGTKGDGGAIEVRKIEHVEEGNSGLDLESFLNSVSPAHVHVEGSQPRLLDCPRRRQLQRSIRRRSRRSTSPDHTSQGLQLRCCEQTVAYQYLAGGSWLANEVSIVVCDQLVKAVSAKRAPEASYIRPGEKVAQPVPSPVMSVWKIPPGKPLTGRSTFEGSGLSK